MKYSKIVGLLGCAGVIIISFFPWTYHADVNKYFTGFFSENNLYGKPGKFFVAFGLIAALLILIPRIWAKRTNLFFSALFLGYAIKTYILYSSCYKAYCPDKQPGLYILMLSCILILFAAVFPDMKLKKLNSEKIEPERN